MTISLKCSHCGGFMYEDDTYYDETGVKIQEISCIVCPEKRYFDYNRYKLILARSVRQKEIAQKA